MASTQNRGDLGIGHAVVTLVVCGDCFGQHSCYFLGDESDLPPLAEVAAFLRWTGEVYAVGGRTNEALATYREAETLWKQVAMLDAALDGSVKAHVATIDILRGEIYAANRAQRQEARAHYQKAIDTLSKLKAENQVSLEQLRDLTRAKERLRALDG